MENYQKQLCCWGCWVAATATGKWVIINIDDVYADFVDNNDDNDNDVDDGDDKNVDDNGDDNDDDKKDGEAGWPAAQQRAPPEWWIGVRLLGGKLCRF